MGPAAVEEVSLTGPAVLEEVSLTGPEAVEEVSLTGPEAAPEEMTPLQRRSRASTPPATKARRAQWLHLPAMVPMAKQESRRLQREGDG